MEPSLAIATLRREGTAFAALLTPDALDVDIVSCPGWTLEDLARHLGGVHRWARQAILHGPSEEPAGPSDPGAIRPWFEAGLEELAGTLEDRRPDQECWTFADPPTVAFWLRRQAHETALHRWDAATSLGRSAPVPESLAEDGVDEVVNMYLPRQLRLGRLTAGPEQVDVVSSSGRTFRVSTNTTGERAGSPDATVTGPAEALLLLLWGRIPLADDRLTVTGSAAAAQTLLSKALAP